MTILMIKIDNVFVTTAEIVALKDAMDQLLDDMSITGQSVCLSAKAQARVALEPFLAPDDDREYLMPLDIAKAILHDV